MDHGPAGDLGAAPRAGLVEHLAGEDRVPRERVRAQPAEFAGLVLTGGPLG
nr:hypothetical protein StreXyl84_75880 [Streptomyces sp. Xyl84]